MKNNSNLALTESKSLRDDKLHDVTHDKALEVINKAKALMMAAWKGENLATVAQLAEFYEIEENTLKQIIKRHRDELVEDGLKTLRGKALSDASDILYLANKTTQATVFTPKAALRLGMLLRDSEVAKSVRDVLLYLAVDVVPQQSEEIERMKLELELVKAKTYYMERRDTIRQLHGDQVLALLDGRPDAVVEKIEKVTETIVVRDGRNVSFEGQSTKQMATSLGFKTGAELERWLEKIGRSDLICQGLRVNQASYIPTENISEVKKVWANNQNKSRQLLIGE